MKQKSVFILGAGNMARETYHIYKDLGRNDGVKGFIIQNKYERRSATHTMYGKPVVVEKNHATKQEYSYIGAIGSPNRRMWVEKLENQGFAFDTLIHPSASLWDGVHISQGCIISKGVVLTCDISIGRHTIVNINANINHDCIIGTCVTIGPGVCIGGHVSIGDYAWIGLGTTIIHNIRIGGSSIIAAGSVVVRDIPDGVLAMGVPAKPVRKLKKNDLDNVI